MIPLNEGITGAAAATRAPVLVDDVRQDPRYLNALDAVRSELAVPMMARGKLVGVIDLQSTRLKAYSEQDRSLIGLIGARVAASHRKRAPVPARGSPESHAANAGASVAGIQLDSGSGRIAGQDRPQHARLMNYDAFSIFLVDGKSGAAAPLQRPLRPARAPGQHSHGKGDYRRGGGIARAGARARYRRGPALHRLASRHPFGAGRAVDGAGSRGGRARRGKRPHRLFHRGSSANAVAAGHADRQLRRKRAPV